MTPVKRLELAEERQAKLQEAADPPFVVLLPRLQSEQEWLNNLHNESRDLAISRFFHLTNAGKPIPERLQRAIDKIMVSAWRSASP